MRCYPALYAAHEKRPICSLPLLGLSKSVRTVRPVRSASGKPWPLMERACGALRRVRHLERANTEVRSGWRVLGRCPARVRDALTACAERKPARSVAIVTQAGFIVASVLECLHVESTAQRAYLDPWFTSMTRGDFADGHRTLVSFNDTAPRRYAPWSAMRSQSRSPTSLNKGPSPRSPRFRSSVSTAVRSLCLPAGHPLLDHCARVSGASAARQQRALTRCRGPLRSRAAAQPRRRPSDRRPRSAVGVFLRGVEPAATF